MGSVPQVDKFVDCRTGQTVFKGAMIIKNRGIRRSSRRQKREAAAKVAKLQKHQSKGH